MFGILFGTIGLIFSLVFGLASGTTKVAYGTTKLAVGTTAAATELTLGLVLRNFVRAAALGLVGYFVYEFITGYAQGKSVASDRAASDARLADAVRTGPATSSLSPTPIPAPSPAARSTVTSATRSPIVGAGDHAGQAVQVQDVGGVHHTTRVGRGVIRR